MNNLRILSYLFPLITGLLSGLFSGISTWAVLRTKVDYIEKSINQLCYRLDNHINNHK